MCFLGFFLLEDKKKNLLPKTIYRQTLRALFGSYFLKLFLIAVFKNRENTVFVFFKNHSCYLNLIFYVFSLIVKNWKPNDFFLFFLFFLFLRIENSFQK